ncbi:hypothetical protein GQ56_0101060 [Burkholderia paludis]|uniref:hypothetical protein n=1 Tax=Burkholderia paludis TaxID=1506587 RepID=UPI0004DB7ADA|nr:hypothetical protein [Burkholderia paludis]KFG99075.1 hypothetical protein GQ56_0101060 [Burkholderia paludis]
MITTTTPLYAAIASTLATIERCKSARSPVLPTHKVRLGKLLDMLPSGSGLDSGTQLLEDECKSNKLVFQADFHHMNRHGMYDGWSEHHVIVTPSLDTGAVIRITGRNRNSIKAYLHDVFHHALFQEVDPYPIGST